MSALNFRFGRLQCESRLSAFGQIRSSALRPLQLFRSPRGTTEAGHSRRVAIAKAGRIAWPLGVHRVPRALLP